MNPFSALFLVFLLVPLLEIWLLIKVGGMIGAGWTIFFVVFTAITGAALVRMQGLSTIQKIQGMMGRGQMPAVEVMEGMALFVAGALLLTPGFFTDGVGFFLLVPPWRRALIQAVLKRSVLHMSGHTGARRPGAPPHPPSGRPGEGRPLEGEWRRDDD